MKKIAYYTLGALLAVIPFVLMMLAIVTLSYTDMSNREWASISVMLFSIYCVYMLWMFGD
mgnify:CR=1 FL=1